MKFLLEIEADEFIPNVDMRGIPDLAEHLKALFPKKISAFKFIKPGCPEVPFEMSYDAKYIHGAN